MGAVGAYKVDLPLLGPNCTTKEIKQFSRAALVGKKIIWEVGSFKEFKDRYKKMIEERLFFRKENDTKVTAPYWAKPGYVAKTPEETRKLNHYKDRITLFHLYILKTPGYTTHYVSEEDFRKFQGVIVLIGLEKEKLITIF